ncbi:hypothetical protein [Brucella gallinifaecis]|uniref:hypothetical protein n=1 Tax=Brucella gallinifaecis TaxID=215590 RepID=UPI0023600793|nr:hypothetical protein [Brucella gallinifaecis]
MVQLLIVSPLSRSFHVLNRPAKVSGFRNVLGTDLLGARGATGADQRKIDRAIVRGCACGVWSKDEYAKHDAK